MDRSRPRARSRSAPTTTTASRSTVDGLDPSTGYSYWFEAGPTHSPTGRTRTLPAAGRAPFRMAVVCCGDYSRGHFSAYRAAADADVELVLHVGDYIYETRPKGTVRAALPDHEVVSLDDYRTRYAQARGDADLRYLHQRHPVVAIWDDHDIADNAWRHGAKHHDPNEHGPWEDRLLAAARAHQEWLPGRLTDEDDLLDVYRSFTIGDLAELVLMDTRIVGRDVQADEEGVAARRRPRPVPAGRRAAGLGLRPHPGHDPAVVAAGERRGRQPHGAAPGARRQAGRAGPQRLRGHRRPGHVHTTSGTATRPSGSAWSAPSPSGAAAERVILSGDVHSAWAFEGPCDGDGHPVAVEFVAPCITATPMARQLPPGWRKLLDRVAERLPEARWFELEHHGFLRLTVDAAEVRAEWYAIDTEDPDARTVLAAAWRHPRERTGRLEEIADGHGDAARRARAASPPGRRGGGPRRVRGGPGHPAAAVAPPAGLTGPGAQPSVAGDSIPWAMCGSASPVTSGSMQNRT